MLSITRITELLNAKGYNITTEDIRNAYLKEEIPAPQDGECWKPSQVVIEIEEWASLRN